MWVILLAGVGLFFLSQTKPGSDAVSTVEDGVTDAASVVVDKIETLLPGWETYDSYFELYGAQYGVEWTWLKAFALNESSLGTAPSVARGLLYPSDVEGSKSTDGKSWGLMQITLKTAQGLDSNATPEKLNDPEYSIELSARYISQLQNIFTRLDTRFQEWVVKSYNQGPGNTQKEIHETGGGYADAYWERWQRNLQKVVA